MLRVFISVGWGWGGGGYLCWGFLVSCTFVRVYVEYMFVGVYIGLYACWGSVSVRVYICWVYGEICWGISLMGVYFRVYVGVRVYIYWDICWRYMLVLLFRGIW